ncbi:MULTISPECIES: hypothetical protein [unclassified Bradyrhizobium]|uniref:hypothetical protein n=1 Tax=Bradyrhizobium sp. USDA 4541 TaxID=2817704 RepID=UPI0020A3887E|nr:hypothetical protein [Bradyrhizobium sp. USDA 4541]MCP1852762.1 hypothetical protein [Bradyrhizobium sp. USDA 4541]
MPTEKLVSDFKITLSPDGAIVKLSATQDGSSTTLNFPPDVVGALVVGLLGAAAVRATAPPPIKTGEMPPDPYVMAGGVGLSDVPDRPDAFAFTFGFGQTLLSIGLDRKALGPLGKGMMAASADHGAKPS